LGATRRVPISTYRLQFSRTFGFNDARALLLYLRDLGIDTIYASPIFRARPGSRHGYDIVDPNELNPDLGTARDFELLTETVRKHGMGWLQDIVPNHMAFHRDNSMLMDVLKLGKASPCFDYFDIDWDHPDEGLRGRLMAPFLERPYAECLKRGDFALRLGEVGICVTYRHHAFPIRADDYGPVLGPEPDDYDPRLRDDNRMNLFMTALAAVVGLADEEAPRQAGAISTQIETMWRLYGESEVVSEYVDSRLERVRGPTMDALLRRQRFALVPWQDTADAVNYRRFFDVNGFIGLTSDHEQTLAATHTLVSSLVEAGSVTGLRIDHIDGLRLPESYILSLRERVGRAYLVVEKILAGGEHLRWLSVDGTTGYDFLNTVNGIFCKRQSRDALGRIYAGFTGCVADPGELLYEKKKVVMNSNLKADLDNLARWLTEALEETPWQEITDRLPTVERLREALVETIAGLGVYRTYLSPVDQSWHDGIPIAEALSRAESRNPHLLDELRLLASLLMAAPRLTGHGSERTGNLNFAMKLQQYTGAVMAKGFEDTFLYVYNRLISLNEVGGDPAGFGCDLADFHAFNLARSSSHPHSMSATSTHDTKRGEDVRARINVLSEIPGEWEERVTRWAGINASRKVRKNGKDMPGRNDEYLLYQTLAGTYPFEKGDRAGYRYRISRYVRKAAREAKVHTRWNDPDTSYSEAFAAFAESILMPAPDNAFLADFLPFQRRVAHYGVLNSLSQTLVKVCAPGVPDFYQGTELWDLSLVDPDNRRPVDFGLRARMLEEIMADAERDPAYAVQTALEDIPSGKIKLFLIHKALAARKSNAYLFEKGTYTELKTEGNLAGHVVAFARTHFGSHAVCIAPRFMTGVVGEGDYPLGLEVWGDTAVALPPGSPRKWVDALTGRPAMADGAIQVGDALSGFPVSLLLEEGT
jgi:(1->4)-alpha-D-glucan 1-alpha-D-glucosylmutase